MEGPPRLAAIATLFRSDASLEAGLIWLTQEVWPALSSPNGGHVMRGGHHIAALRLQPGQPGLSAAGVLLVEMMRSLLVLTGIAGEPVLNRRGLSIERLVNDELISLPLSALGEGLHTIGALILDLVRQLYGFFGALKQAKAPGKFKQPRLLNTGVVVIDEMENHLHPQLQQQIGFWLTDTFPKVQFLVTTHSPFICQAADPGALFRLNGDGQVKPLSDDLYAAVVNGSANEAVLTELFGLRTPYSSRSNRLREEIARLGLKIQRDQASAEEMDRREKLLTLIPQSPDFETAQVLNELLDIIQDTP